MQTLITYAGALSPDLLAVKALPYFAELADFYIDARYKESGLQFEVKAVTGAEAFRN